jgi:hypothetical protein
MGDTIVKGLTAIGVGFLTVAGVLRDDEPDSSDWHPPIDEPDPAERAEIAELAAFMNSLDADDEDSYDDTDLLPTGMSEQNEDD